MKKSLKWNSIMSSRKEAKTLVTEVVVVHIRATLYKSVAIPVNELLFLLLDINDDSISSPL